MAVQSHDRSVEIFRIRTEDEIRKKQARRKKRAKEKEATKGKQKVQEPEDIQGEHIELADLFTPYLVVRASGKVRSFSFMEDGTGPKGTPVSY